MENIFAVKKKKYTLIDHEGSQQITKFRREIERGGGN
jgi:hypothetical protein